MYSALRKEKKKPRKIKFVGFGKRHKVLDIFLGGEKRIYIKNFSKKKFRWAVELLILFIILLINAYLPRGKADSVQFYPAVCLGGWENPQNAQGKPDLPPGASEEEFNEQNSAVLRNTISEIYCSDFKGELPENLEPKKFILKFSWAFKKQKQVVIPQAEFNGPAPTEENSPAPTEIAPEEVLQSSPTENQNTGSEQNQEPQEPSSSAPGPESVPAAPPAPEGAPAVPSGGDNTQSFLPNYFKKEIASLGMFNQDAAGNGEFLAENEEIPTPIPTLIFVETPIPTSEQTQAPTPEETPSPAAETPTPIPSPEETLSPSPTPDSSSSVINPTETKPRSWQRINHK